MPGGERKGLIGLRATFNPQEALWELPLASLQGCATVLIGWTVDAQLAESKVPEQVACILARALTRSHALTYLDPGIMLHIASQRWQSTPEGWACILMPSGFHGKRKDSALPLVCTSRSNVAAQLFFTDHFIWNLKTQVGILSRRDCSPPTVSYQRVRDVLDRRLFDPWQFASEARAQGILLPGVDGDFAALSVFESDVLGKIQEYLIEECSAAKVNWEVVRESEFKRTVWFVANEPGL